MCKCVPRSLLDDLAVTLTHFVLLADAIQQELDMIPLLMEHGFKAKGWLVSAPALFRSFSATVHVCSDKPCRFRAGTDHGD